VYEGEGRGGEGKRRGWDQQNQKFNKSRVSLVTVPGDFGGGGNEKEIYTLEKGEGLLFRIPKI